MKEGQADVEKAALKVKQDPGITGWRDAQRRIDAETQAQAQAERDYAALGCDQQAVAAEVAQEDQQNAAQSAARAAFLKQLDALEQAVKSNGFETIQGELRAKVNDAGAQAVAGAQFSSRRNSAIPNVSAVTRA